MAEISYHQHIRGALLEQIKNLPDGEKIPSEHQLCARFGVSRMTVNKVICELARDGYLVRRRPQGTFVSKKTAASRLTFLLPSTDYISIPGWFQQLFLGSLNGARECGAAMETIVVSATNSQEDMTPEILASLDSSSLVIVCGFWFKPLFAALLEKKCRVLYHGNMILHNDPVWQPRTAAWQKYVNDRRHAVYLLTRQLLNIGRRRIVLLSPYLNEPNHPYLTGYLTAIREAGAEPLPLRQTDPEAGLDNLGAGVYRFLEEAKADALIFNDDRFFGHAGEKVNRYYHLPEQLAVAMPGYNPEANYFNAPPLYTRFNMPELARQTAKKLLTEPFQPGEEIVPPIFFDGTREISNPAELPAFPEGLDISNYPIEQIRSSK